MLMLTPIVLAIVSIASVRELLQNVFAYGSVLVADHMIAAAVAILALGVLCASVARLCARRPLGPVTSVDCVAPSPQWQWFAYGNAVSAVAFPVSLAVLVGQIAQHSPAATPWAVLSQHKWAAAAATASFSYLLLFLGVGLVVPPAPASPAHSTVRPVARTSSKPIAEDPDVIVIGAGTTGASLAASLGRRGYRVLCIEKTIVQPDRIVGELLQPGGLRVLERLGLGDCAKEGIDSVPVRGYSVFKTDGTELPLSYPAADPAGTRAYLGMDQFKAVDDTKDCDAQTPAADGSLPPPRIPDDGRPLGRSFHNTRFVDNLRAACIAEPNVHFQEGTAKQLVTEPCKAAGPGKQRITGVTWADKSGQSHTVMAPLTVVADGIWSNFRRRMTPSRASTVSYFVGYVLHHPAHASPLPRRYHGHVVLADPTPVLLYQISSTETRILVDTGNKLPSTTTGEMQKFMLEVTLPQLPEGLRDAFREAVTTQQPKSMPNRGLAATPDPLHVGGLLLGDSFNMRHPLTGGGMTVCLKDVEMFLRALEVYCPGGAADLADLPRITKAVKAFQKDRAAHASTVNVLAYALYRVFSRPAADDGSRQQFRDACFDYLACGGARTAGPIGLLSALTPFPWVLASHFFFVASHAMRDALLPLPTPGKLRRAYNILHVACIIIMPQLEQEGVTFLATWPLRFVTNLIFPWRGVAMEQ